MFYCEFGKEITSGDAQSIDHAKSSLFSKEQLACTHNISKKKTFSTSRRNRNSSADK